MLKLPSGGSRSRPWGFRAMTTRVYISGPITGVPDLNRPAFASAARILEERGFETVNPHDNGLQPDAPWSEHMRADIRALTTCDRLVYLPGSDASRGAAVERYVAAALGIPESPIEDYQP